MNFTQVYISGKRLSFHLPHLHILGNYQSINKRHEAFKYNGSFQYVLFCRDDEERVVSSFAQNIQYKYYVGTLYVY